MSHHFLRHFGDIFVVVDAVAIIMYLLYADWSLKKEIQYNALIIFSHNHFYHTNEFTHLKIDV